MLADHGILTALMLTNDVSYFVKGRSIRDRALNRSDANLLGYMNRRSLRWTPTPLDNNIVPLNEAHDVLAHLFNVMRGTHELFLLGRTNKAIAPEIKGEAFQAFAAVSFSTLRKKRRSV
jgi:hypothetical protein